MKNRPKFDVEYIPCPKAGQTHYGCGVCDKHASSPSQKEETWRERFKELKTHWSGHGDDLLLEYHACKQFVESEFERARQECKTTDTYGGIFKEVIKLLAIERERGRQEGRNWAVDMLDLKLSADMPYTQDELDSFFHAARSPQDTV